MDKLPTKKETEDEIRLTGGYVPRYKEGDKLVHKSVTDLNKTKKPTMLEVLEVYTPLVGLPTYRLLNLKEGVKKSAYCNVADTKYRSIGGLEGSIFFD